MPAELIAKFNNVFDQLPVFAPGTIDAVHEIYDSGFLYVGDDIRDRMTAGLDAIASRFFAMVGHLLKSNEPNLSSTTEIVREIAQVLPAMAGGGAAGTDLSAALALAESAFDTEADGSKTLRVQLALDALPAMQSAFGTPPLQTAGR
ncbi:MAG: hypothetical protein WAW17_29135 [Rhodococcus sp. (in: high G+C Gram-positive bacteria)]|uniref:hypothetical protein n=1 Tax=Rhodococcus sp. TaxID=1831 RepID=UPI003BB1C79D